MVDSTRLDDLQGSFLANLGYDVYVTQKCPPRGKNAKVLRKKFYLLKTIEGQLCSWKYLDAQDE